MRMLAVAAVVTVMAFAFAHAQDATTVTAARAINAAEPAPPPEVIAAEVLKAEQINAETDKKCRPTAVRMEMPKPSTTARLVANGISGGQLKNGWTAYGTPIGCESLRQRYVILRLADSSVIARPVNTGESLANLSIMRDTSAGVSIAALQAIIAVDPACKGDDLTMLSSRVVDRADLGPDFYGTFYTGQWREGWTFGACGKQAEVVVEFKADGNGGAYTSLVPDLTRITK